MTTLVLLVVAITMVTWFVTGMPGTVETALADALWEPCPPRYALAKNATDSSDVDSVVLKPRSRFERAITCGTIRQKRAAALR